MDSYKLFVSDDGKLLANIGTYVTLWNKKRNTLRQILAIKDISNPHTISISQNGANVLIKDNAGLITIYDIKAKKKIFKSHKNRCFGGAVYYLSNDTILSSDCKGRVYTLNIATNKLEYIFKDNTISYLNLFKAEEDLFFIIGRDKNDNFRRVYSIKTSPKIIQNMLIEITEKISLSTMIFCNDKLYFITDSCKLIRYDYNRNNESVENKCILMDCLKDYGEELAKNREESLYNEFPSLKGLIPINLAPIKMIWCASKKCIFIVFNYGILIFDDNTFECLKHIQFKRLIMDVIFDEESQQLYFSEGVKLSVCAIDDLINGLCSPKEPILFM